jgi:hypothetical protein
MVRQGRTARGPSILLDKISSVVAMSQERTYSGQEEVENEDRVKRIEDSLFVFCLNCALWYFSAQPNVDFPSLEEAIFQ